MTSTLSKLLAAALAMVAVAGGVMLALSQRASAPPALVATVFDQPRPLPAFELVDADGLPRDAQSLHGRWTWLFFGFTTCPDVCPATLSILANAVAQIPAAQRPDVYLISVDPERDTPARLKPYVTHFDPTFNALTGELDQVTDLAERLFAAFAKVPLDNGDYTMDHFAGIYFVNDRVEIVAISTTPHFATALAADYLAVRRR